MKNIIPLVALVLLFSVSSPNAFSGALEEPRSPESPAVSISPLVGAPTPIKMSCSIGWNANDDYVTTAKNTAVNITPLANDADTPQQNFGGIIDGPYHGTAVQVGLDGIRYTPAANYTGSDTITYQHIGCLQCFGSGSSAWCSEPSDDTATIYITVTN